MSQFDNAEALRLASDCDELDRRAGVLRDEILLLGDSWPNYGIAIAPVAKSLNMTARVHHVNVLIRYGHRVAVVDAKRQLQGVFTVVLDEPMKYDQTPITWFSFDNHSNTWSPENIVRRLIRHDNELSIKQDFALLLAHGVQQYIQKE